MGSRILQAGSFTRYALVAVLVSLVCVAAADAHVVPSSFGNSADHAFEGRRVVHSMAPNAPQANEVRNVNTGTFYNSIQDAINDPTTLNGHTLEVVADFVEGQVNLSKSVTLRGATGAEVVRAGVDTGTSGDNRGWFLVPAGVNVTVQNLNFDGNGHKVHQGFRVSGTATFTGCTLNAIQYEATGPQYAGYAIAASNNVTVTGCTIQAFGRDGILLFGPGVTNGIVQDSTFIGLGAFPGLNYGIEVGGGAHATLTNNRTTLSQGTLTAEVLSSAGIAVSTYFGAGTAATITSNNTFTNGIGIQIGIGAGYPNDSSVVNASCNRIFGNELGFGSTSPTVTAENNWWGCNAGPNDVTALCDTMEGTLDADPWLILSIAANPSVLTSADVSQILSDLTRNSDGMDISASCHVPDGLPVAYASTGGTVAPPTGTTSAGESNTQYTAGPSFTGGSVSATVDNQTVTTNLGTGPPGGAGIPSTTPLGAALLLALIVLAGIELLRRQQ